MQLRLLTIEINTAPGIRQSLVNAVKTLPESGMYAKIKNVIRVRAVPKAHENTARVLSMVSTAEWFFGPGKQYLRRFPEVGTTEVWQYGRGAISC